MDNQVWKGLCLFIWERGTKESEFHGPFPRNREQSEFLVNLCSGEKGKNGGGKAKKTTDN